MATWTDKMYRPDRDGPKTTPKLTAAQIAKAKAARLAAQKPKLGAPSRASSISRGPGVPIKPKPLQGNNVVKPAVMPAKFEDYSPRQKQAYLAYLKQKKGK